MASLPFHSLHGWQTVRTMFGGCSRGGVLIFAFDYCLQVDRMDMLERSVFVMLGKSAPVLPNCRLAAPAPYLCC